MSVELTNLLPPEKQRALKRAYYLRVASAGFVLLSVILVFHGLLLLSTHLLLRSQIQVRTEKLEQLSQGTAGNASAFELRLNALSARTRQISTLDNSYFGSQILLKTLETPRSGITLSSLAYIAPAEKKKGTVALSGIASTRDTLRNYQLALQGLPFVAQADLPVSAYAADANIPFTVTLTLVTPTP